MALCICSALSFSGKKETSRPKLRSGLPGMRPKGERTEGRLGYRSGYYQRDLITRVATLELRVPQDQADRFSTEAINRCLPDSLAGTSSCLYAGIIEESS